MLVLEIKLQSSKRKAPLISEPALQPHILINLMVIYEQSNCRFFFIRSISLLNILKHGSMFIIPFSQFSFSKEMIWVSLDLTAAPRRASCPVPARPPATPFSLGRRAALQWRCHPSSLADCRHVRDGGCRRESFRLEQSVQRHRGVKGQLCSSMARVPQDRRGEWLGLEAG